MGLADNGYTTLPEFNFDQQIRERFDPIEQLGVSQTNYVQEAAQRRLAQQQADEQAAWANAQQQGENSVSYSGGSGRSGGTGSFAGFMRAISGQESGNNYAARNSMSGAMGKYQIMPSNIQGAGGWDREALGYDITPSQFMASPQLQERIAQYKLQQYYNAYGPAGAAIAWYAGPGAAQQYVRSGAASTHGEAGGHPSVSQYMYDILRRMGLA